MDAVLIVSSGERAANMLSDLLSSKHDFSISIAGDILTASRMFEEKEYNSLVKKYGSRNEAKSQSSTI